MNSTLTVSRRLPSKDVKRGPPQIPIEERTGIHMSRDLWDVFQGDSLKRDVFSVSSRIREWEETEELHIKNMESPLQVNTAKLRLPPYGIHLLAGDMGSGKTLAAAWMGREYYRAGWPVYSTAGFLFGQRLRIEEAYSFPDAMQPGSFVFADEIHAMLDRYSSNSVRSRTFGQATTAMRKEHVTCIGASANSNMVDWSFRGASECVLVPRRWYPPRGRKLHAPPFCYLEISKMYPFPYRRRDPLLMDGGLLKGTEVKIATWRPSPVELMAAAKLIDSFEAVRLGENFGIDAAAMRKLREDKEGGGGGGGADEDARESGEPSNRLLIVIKRAYETGYLKTSGTIALTTIRDVLRQSGLKTVTATAIKSALEMSGCDVTTRSIEAEELADLFDSINLED